MSNPNPQGKVLVTGSTGFVGSHLVDLLIERGHSVKCLVRRTTNLRHLKDHQIDLAYGGLEDSTDWDEALANVDTIYHVAGTTFARRAEDYFTVNQKSAAKLRSTRLGPW